MKLKPTVIAGLLAGLLLHSCGAPAEDKDYRIVAYYPSYKASDSLLPEETFRKITHVNFSFALPAADGSLEYANVARSVRNTAEMTKKTGVKVLVSVGGGGGSELQHAFAAAIHEKESREILVNNLMKMTDELGLDGLDIDYEAWKLKDEQYDLELCAALEDFLCQLRQRLGPDRLLTSAVATYGKYTQAMVDSFDYITVMAYDLTGPWGNEHGPHSPFEYFTSSIGIFQEMGFPDDKIVGGVPFYGYGFPGEGNDGAYSMTYADIVKNYPGAEHMDCVNDELWYDGIDTITKKCEYVMNNSLGGIMFWEITQDTTDPELSLLQRIHSLLMAQ